MSLTDGGPFLTRKNGINHIRAKLGIPVTNSTFAKKAMKRETPPPDGYYGRTELYRPTTLERWALAELCSDKPKKLGAA
jgi:hypothetical protein